MYTRQDYMKGKCSHSDYYRDVIMAMGGPKAIPCPVSADRIDAALAQGDVHLNTIPLAAWDACVPMLRRASVALRNRGDWLTLSGGVCILKEAARWRSEARQSNKQSLAACAVKPTTEPTQCDDNSEGA